MKKQFDKICQTSSLSSQNSNGSELARPNLELEKIQKLLEEEKVDQRNSMMKRTSNQNSREKNSQIKSNSGNSVDM